MKYDTRDWANLALLRHVSWPNIMGAKNTRKPKYRSGVEPRNDVYFVGENGPSLVKVEMPTPLPAAHDAEMGQHGDQCLHCSRRGTQYGRQSTEQRCKICNTRWLTREVFLISKTNSTKGRGRKEIYKQSRMRPLKSPHHQNINPTNLTRLSIQPQLLQTNQPQKPTQTPTSKCNSQLSLSHLSSPSSQRPTPSRRAPRRPTKSRISPSATITASKVPASISNPPMSNVPPLMQLPWPTTVSSYAERPRTDLPSTAALPTVTA